MSWKVSHQQILLDWHWSQSWILIAEWVSNSVFHYWREENKCYSHFVSAVEKYMKAIFALHFSNSIDSGRPRWISTHFSENTITIFETLHHESDVLISCFFPSPKLRWRIEFFFCRYIKELSADIRAISRQ